MKFGRGDYFPRLSFLFLLVRTLVFSLFVPSFGARVGVAAIGK